MTRLEEIPVGQIDSDQDYNIARNQFTLESLHELAGSIRQNGLQSPVMVRPYGDGGKPYILVTGFRRFHAVAYVLKHETIQAIVKEMTDEEAVVLNIIENIDRENLNPIEEARAIRVAFPDLSEIKIAEKLNRTKGWVGARLRLLKLPEEVQLMLASGRLKATDAIRIAKEAEPADQIAVARAILKQRERNTGNRPDALRKGKVRIQKEITQLQIRLLNNGLHWLAPRVASWCAGFIDDAEINADIERAIEEKKRGT